MGQRLWILNHYAVTPDMAGGTRHFELARRLVQAGNDVTILASSFHHGQRREMRLRGRETWRVELVDGVRFVWLRTPPYERNDWHRIANMLGYAARSYLLGRRLPQSADGVLEPDVIIGSTVHLLAVVSAFALARFYRAHFMMEVRDLWPQTLVDMGRLAEHSPVTRLLRGLETFLYRRAECIVVLLPKAPEYVAGLGIDKAKVVWIPNGVDVSQFVGTRSAAPAQRPFTIMYVGAHGRANALSSILDACATLHEQGHDDIRVVLVGDGPEKRALQAYASERNLPNVEFRDAVAKSAVPGVLEEADALVLVLRDLALYKYGISLNKLFDYLAAGRPIVLAGHPANNVVEEAGCGLTVAPGDACALADAFVRVSELPAGEREAMGERGRQYARQHHDWSVLALRLEECIESIAHD